MYAWGRMLHPFRYPKFVIIAAARIIVIEATAPGLKIESGMVQKNTNWTHTSDNHAWIQSHEKQPQRRSLHALNATQQLIHG
mmetsp:Transcript_27750/g.40868  ORF Transcript_27750/g.40868 Transcript_27750/m.40868 type:complete len:82 (+) Transcript_27750:2073-2318(+)